MGRFRAQVRVQLKPGVLDPQGQAVAGALRALGFSGVEDVRVGRWILVDLQAGSLGEARAAAEEMCRRLLANPVLEDYAVDVVEVAPEVAGRLGSPLNPGAAARGLAPAGGGEKAGSLPWRGVPAGSEAGPDLVPGAPGLPPVEGAPPPQERAGGARGGG